MIDRETEDAVERWVRLGDQVVHDGPKRAARAFCARCGTTAHVLGYERGALCARCYLERPTARPLIRRLAR